jgi:hypothetical protein
MNEIDESVTRGTQKFVLNFETLAGALPHWYPFKGSWNHIFKATTAADKPKEANLGLADQGHLQKGHDEAPSCL